MSGTSRSASPPPAHRRQLVQPLRHRPLRDGRFVAKDVPYACTVELLDSVMKREEERRAEVRRRRSEYLTSIAALPPRMHRHMEAKRVEHRARTAEEERRFRAEREQRQRRWAESERRADEGESLIPDFTRLHAEFAAELQLRKEEQPSTRPEAFRFRHTTRVIDRHRTSRQRKADEQQREQQLRREEEEHQRRRRELRRRRAAEKFLSSPSDAVAVSRGKSGGKGKEGEGKGGEEERGGRVGEGRVKEELRAALAGHWSVQEATAARIRRQAEEGRRALKDAEERWAQEVRRMKEKVHSRPLLLHGHVKREREKEEQRRTELLDIQRTLEAAGVEDHSDYFAAEELEQLQGGGEESR